MTTVRSRVLSDEMARAVRHRRLWRPAHLPILITAGLLVLLAGAVIDIVAHVGLATPFGPHGEDAGHIITLLGMALIFARVFSLGLQSHRR
jgi:hypothetical protein